MITMEASGFDWGVVSVPCLQELSSLSLSMLIDAKSVDFAAEIASIAEKNGKKAGLLKGVTRELISVFQVAMKEGKSSQKLRAHLQQTLEMPTEVAAGVIQSWDSSQGRISASLLAKTLKAKRLVDLDWTFGVTASTSEMDQVGSAFLQLKMTLDTGDNTTQDEYLELSIDQFFSFLSSLEQCKKFLDLVSSAEE